MSVKTHTWVATFPSSRFVPAGSASQEHGYLCKFSDADLLVSLPLKFLGSSLCVFMLFFGCAVTRWTYVNVWQGPPVFVCSVVGHHGYEPERGKASE